MTCGASEVEIKTDEIYFLTKQRDNFHPLFTCRLFQSRNLDLDCGTSFEFDMLQVHGRCEALKRQHSF